MLDNSDALLMKRFSIRLPSWHYKRLIWWARGKGQSISGLAERTIAARIEANADLIEGMVADKAEDLGLTPEEVKRQWLLDNPSDYNDSEGDVPEN